MIYIHAKFYKPSSNDSSVIATKRKTKYRLQTAALFKVLPTNYLNKVAYFSKISYHTSRSMKCTERVERIRDMRNVYTILVGKSEGKSPLGRPRHR